jgi:GT2 family glycosyltransferase
MSAIGLGTVGIVAIGRNEGKRLVQCLLSIADPKTAVYVDSNSSDNSIEVARSLGVEVVELDMSQPFSAARARNAGLQALQRRAPLPEFVQFVDGDCEIADGWIERGLEEFRTDETVAVVAGRRRERHPFASIYNRLCDIEWNTPIGDAKACGGDCLIRMTVLRDVGGYNGSVIAGEEPELCVRIREAGWKVRRIDAEMTLHDAAMHRFSQWWKRMQRSGHAYAQGAAMHGAPPECHWVREQTSIILWGGIVPICSIGLAWLTNGWSMCLLFGYLVLALRSFRYYRQRQFEVYEAVIATSFNLLAKFPQITGVCKFHVSRLLARQPSIIEYKGVTT